MWGEGGAASWLNLGLLYLGFMGLLRLWGTRVHRQRLPWTFYGLVISRRFGREMGVGGLLGLGLIMGLFGVFGGLGWATFNPLPTNWVWIIVEGSVLGLAVGFAEELLFRGWLQQELELDYQPNAAVLIQALVFAALHFIRPLDVIIATSPQFLGLVLLSLVLGWAKQACHGRLGFSMGLHGGLVAGYFWVNVGNFVEIAADTPEWLTGLGGNPLAGLVGIGLLVFMGGMTYWRAAVEP